MESAQLEQLAVLRAAVGFLGERYREGWWPSSFFDDGGEAFLGPIFARTRVLAQYQGVVEAAAVVHDERIGVGNVFHLFRLSEDLEQALHRLVHEGAVAAQIAEHAATPEAALEWMRQFGDGESRDGLGPVRVATLSGIRDMTAWRAVATHYVSGLTGHNEVYPYFADK